MFELFFTHPLWAYRAGTFALAGAWPRWMLAALIAAASAAIVAGLWRRRYLGAPRLAALAALQISLATLVIGLLWRPVLNVERVRDRQNVLAIVVDNSASMAQVDDSHAGAGQASATQARAEVAEGISPTRLQQAIAAIQGGPLAELAQTFELRFFTFGEAAGSSVAPIESLSSLPAPGSQTRIGDALLGVMQTAGSVPLAGVILISDGAENARSLSEAALRDIASYGVPVHAVGVGPERIENDVELAAVDLPASIAPGATVTADVTVRHSGAANTRLRIYDNDALLAARDLKLTASTGEATTSSATTIRVEFPAGAAGVRDLRFALEPLAGERNQVNNTRRTALNVPATRRALLYVEGEPRWEFKFIRRAVEGERSLRLASVVRTTQNKFYRQGVTSGEELTDGLPTTAEELFAYDALIVGSFEAPALTPAQQQLLKDFVDKRGGGLLMLAGNNGLAGGGWGASPLAEVLPVHLPVKRTKDFEQGPAKALLTRYGAESTVTRFDPDAKRNADLWQGLPDLANYQRVGALRPGAIVLLEAGIEKDKKTRVPLLISQRYGRGSAFVLATASTQRWQMSMPVEDERHEMFWRQLLHALADQAPSQAWLGSQQVAYEDERDVRLHVELRNHDFDPTHEAQVELSVTPEHGAPFVAALQASPTEPGRYVAAIDAAATGLYRADLTARLADKKTGKDQVVTASTAFRRDDNVVEYFDARQHRAVLERVARDTQGRYWRLDQLSELGKAIPYTKSGIVERQVLDLWNLPIVFLLLLALKLGEWLLRLRWGTL